MHWRLSIVIGSLSLAASVARAQQLTGTVQDSASGLGFPVPSSP